MVIFSSKSLFNQTGFHAFFVENISPVYIASLSIKPEVENLDSSISMSFHLAVWLNRPIVSDKKNSF